MFWILQHDLYNESAFEDLLEQLKYQEVPYQIVSVEKGLIVGEGPTIDASKRIFVCGGTTLCSIANKRGWQPGYFDENLDYALYLQHYGPHMLNHGAVVKPLGELSKIWDKFFIRPVYDSKQFSGKILDWSNFEYWRNQVREWSINKPDTTKLTMQDRVVMSPLKQISAEYRFFVVDGKVITGAMYKLGQVVLYSERIDSSVWEYAQARVDDWAPNRAFVLDIADTLEGLKVLEINAINSAGFYACDMGKFVHAIESMK